jgi:phage shock protein PspC (stress-responsive transcriptional regulator)
MKTIAKIQQDKWLGGVCSGWAYAFGIPTWIVRLLMFGFAVLTGIPCLLYILMWVFMPRWTRDPHDYIARTQPPLDSGVA